MSYTEIVNSLVGLLTIIVAYLEVQKLYNLYKENLLKSIGNFIAKLRINIWRFKNAISQNGEDLPNCVVYRLLKDFYIKKAAANYDDEYLKNELINAKKISTDFIDFLISENDQFPPIRKIDRKNYIENLEKLVKYLVQFSNLGIEDRGICDDTLSAENITELDEKIKVKYSEIVGVLNTLLSLINNIQKYILGETK
jgi:hypothetical protein